MSRITNAMLTNNYLSDVQTNLKSMSTFQSQMSSGQKIQIASDDPAIAVKTLKLNTEIASNKQYSQNITDTTNWLNTTDTALSESGNVLSRIRELMVKAGNGSYGTDDISTIKDEVVSAVGELGQLLNTSYDGNYIFGGAKSTSKAVTVDSNGNMSYADKDGNAISKSTSGTTTSTTLTLADANKITNGTNTIESITKDSTGAVSVKYNNGTTTSTISTTSANLQTDLTNNGFTTSNATKVSSLLSQTDTTLSQISSDLTTEVSEGVKVNYNQSANSLMEFTDSSGTAVNGMNILSGIITNLGIASDSTATSTATNAALTKINGTNLTQLDSLINNFLVARSTTGTMQDRMDSISTTNDDQNYNMTSVLSSTADVDYTEASVGYSSAQQVYTASLQVSSKILSKTLLDYL
jgi:flagellar hook-associated protein 3 FlgL